MRRAYAEIVLGELSGLGLANRASIHGLSRYIQRTGSLVASPCEQIRSFVGWQARGGNRASL